MKELEKIFTITKTVFTSIILIVLCFVHPVFIPITVMSVTIGGATAVAFAFIKHNPTKKTRTRNEQICV